MLSDREAKSLAEMERALLLEDPTLVGRFAAVEQPARVRDDVILNWVLGLTAVLTAIAILLGVYEALLAIALIGGTLAMLRYGVWLCHRMPDQ